MTGGPVTAVEMPAYLGVGLIARADKSNIRKTRRKLARAGLLEHDGKHRYHVDGSRLQERLPGLFERVWLYVQESAGNDHEVP